MDLEVESQLVAALRQGDEGAFVRAYEAHRARVFTFILRMVNRRAIAEELAQEVWMRLALRAQSLHEDTRLEPWLFTVARNLCVSYWRTRGIEGLRDVEPETIERLPGRGVSPAESAASHELHAQIEHALVRLPRRYREVLLLVGVEGMTPAAAARVCGLSPEAMRKRLERARDMLAGEIRVTRPRRVPVEREPC
jgi:RNA polymerase sigma-70 factor, ECF subfamily